MKSPMFLISVFFLAVFSTLIAGCFCNNITCPEDKPLDEKWETKLPYQPGDRLVFSNIENDTLTFTCSERSIINSGINPDPGREDQCCSPGVVEDLNCKFTSDVGNTISFRTFMGNELIFNITIDTQKWRGDDGLPYLPTFLDSIQLVDKKFFDVTAIRDNVDSTRFIYFKDGQGLLGFISTGEEWALVE